MHHAYLINSKSLTKTLLLIVLSWSTITSASIVRMATVMGDIEIELFDSATPLTVANFMNYVNGGDYVDTFFHRSEPGFVIQGGGYTFNEASNSAPHIAVDAPIVNEFGISNTRGTIAMALSGTGNNSATSEWFINLGNNSANLDFQNGGFTVFGQIIGDGMNVVDAIAALDRVNAGGAFSSVPVIDFSNDQTQLLDKNLVFINNISTVPLPGAVWLFSSGFIGLVGFARRKTRNY